MEKTPFARPLIPTEILLLILNLENATKRKTASKMTRGLQ